MGVALCKVYPAECDPRHRFGATGAAPKWGTVPKTTDLDQQILRGTSRIRLQLGFITPMQSTQQFRLRARSHYQRRAWSIQGPSGKQHTILRSDH